MSLDARYNHFSRDYASQEGVRWKRRRALLQHASPTGEHPQTVSLSGGYMPNRLANETSPYLLQHKHNPVDWYPWGEEAFEVAKCKDKPIFLSIGYSACHWCHVMAHESFEDPETAAIMNEHYINIKVDREERPDVDAVYMNAVQALTGRAALRLAAA